MFVVNGNPLLADEMEVLQELKLQLRLNGIERFANFKRSTNNIQFNCPIHADGHEHKPSCGVSIKTQGAIPVGTVHCFTCGYSATLEEMISNCFGKEDLGRFGREWLVKNFLTVSVESRKDIEMDFSRSNKSIQKVAITEEELSTYRYYHPYMYKRKLTDEVIEQFDVGFDENFKLNPKSTNKIPCITFPVKDLQGDVLFLVRRSIHSKLFHYPEGASKPVYGLYELPKDASEVIVCESVINALTCYVYGKPAVALLGLGTHLQYEQLKRLNCRKLIIALDGDMAGQQATAKLKKALRNSKIVTYYQMPKGKDINDLSQEEFNNLIELF